MLPTQIADITSVVLKKFPTASVGIHAHNDGDLAVANSLFALQAGADLLQGTINGIGERTGNANLCSLLPHLELKLKYHAIGSKNLRKLKSISELVATRGNYHLPHNMPFVG